MKMYLTGVFGSMLLLSACSTTLYALHPQSHYDYPNSNIKPLGEAIGKAQQISFLMPPMAMSGEMEREAVEEALKTKPGADILVNYISETKILMLPYIYVTDYTVHGTAASMLIGKQSLK